MSLSELKKNIGLLEHSLFEDGKNETANFFTDILTKIELSEKNECLPTEALELTVSCGAISQYANFNDHQIELLERIIALAENEL